MRISQAPSLIDAFSSCIFLSIDQETAPPSFQNKLYFAFSLLSSLPFLIPITLSWNEFSAYWNKVGILARTLPSILIFRGICKIAKTAISFVISVRPSAKNNSTLIGWLSMKYDVWIFSKICQTNSSFFNMTRITDTLHEDQCTSIITPRCIKCRKNKNTHFSENRAVF